MTCPRELPASCPAPSFTAACCLSGQCLPHVYRRLLPTLCAYALPRCILLAAYLPPICRTFTATCTAARRRHLQVPLRTYAAAAWSTARRAPAALSTARRVHAAPRCLPPPVAYPLRPHAAAALSAPLLPAVGPTASDPNVCSVGCAFLCTVDAGVGGYCIDCCREFGVRGLSSVLVCELWCCM